MLAIVILTAAACDKNDDISKIDFPADKKSGSASTIYLRLKQVDHDGIIE